MFLDDKPIVPNIVEHPCLKRWRATCKEAIGRGFTERDISQASNWNMCAAWEATSEYRGLVPDEVLGFDRGVPNDSMLWNLGHTFAIEVKSQRPVAALKVIDEIETYLNGHMR